MGASSVTGVGQSSARKRVAYRNELEISNLDINPKVVSAGLVTLDGAGQAIIGLVDFYGTLNANCNSNICSWIASIEIAVGTSYYQGNANYAAIRWDTQADDPVFTQDKLLDGSAPKPNCAVTFLGEPNATISYVITTFGNRR